jgi:hypothetical protein
VDKGKEKQIKVEKGRDNLRKEEMNKGRKRWTNKEGREEQRRKEWGKSEAK